MRSGCFSPLMGWLHPGHAESHEMTLAGGLQDFTLNLNGVEQLLPRFVEGLGALRLEVRGKFVEIDSCLPEICQNRLAVSAISRKRPGYLTVVSEREKRLFRHGVDRVRRSERIDIENI